MKKAFSAREFELKQICRELKAAELNSKEKNSDSLESKSKGLSKGQTKVPVAKKCKGRARRNSNEEAVNSAEEEESMKNNFRPESTMPETGKELKTLNSPQHPGETLNFSIDRASTGPLSPISVISTHSDETCDLLTMESGAASPASPSNTSLVSSSTMTQQPPFNQYTPTNRNYSFLAGPTQVDNLTRQTPALKSSSTESERLRILKQKKENKDRKKHKNLNVYTTGPKDTTNGMGSEFSIDEILESLGEINIDKQQNKKLQKLSKTISNKQINSTGKGKSNYQRKSLGQTEPCLQEKKNEEDVTTAKENNVHKKMNRNECSPDMSLSKGQKNNNQNVKKGKNVKTFIDASQVKEMANISNNFVSIDNDLSPPGDLKRQVSKSTENLFTTVLPKKHKHKKKAATDADIPQLGIGVNSSPRGYQSNISRRNEFFQPRGSSNGESISESTSLATDLDLAADFPPLGINESSSISTSGNGQNISIGDEHPVKLMANRAPLPKAVWPIVRPHVSTSDSTAVIENISNPNTHVNENVNNNASDNNSNNAVVSPDVSISSISTSSFTTASSNITIGNIISSQGDTTSNSAGSLIKNASVAQNDSTPTIPSYSSALLGNNNSHKVIANQPPKDGKQTSNLPATTEHQNAMLTDSNPPDITVQVTNALNAQSSLPDVTAQTPVSVDCNASADYTPNGDSMSDSPPPYISADVNNIDDNASYANVASAANLYQEDFASPVMQHGNTSMINDQVSPAGYAQVDSPNTCFYVDDNRAVAIVLSESAYNNNYAVNNHEQTMNIGTVDDIDPNVNVPAVTILGRGETPVADWSSRCDGLEFGGPVNEDLLSMDYVPSFDMEPQVINFIQPDEAGYQAMGMENVHTNAIGGSSREIVVSEHNMYVNQQCIATQEMPRKEDRALPDIDGAILSFGESFEQNNHRDLGVKASTQVVSHTFDTNENELSNGQDSMENMRNVKNTYLKNEKSGSCDLLAFQVNANAEPCEEKLTQDSAKNRNNASQSITPASINSCEENISVGVPLNDELNDFSATNWANEVAKKFQLETESSHSDDPQSSSFIEANLTYDTNAAINEANSKATYNYQEILSFVSNSWQQMEKELTSGTKGKYYYSKSGSNNKPNSSIAKLNNNV